MERSDVRPGLGETLRARVELWLAIVLMALAFGAGVVVRGLAQSPQPWAATMSALVPAPPLSSEQIQQGLPEGHPPVDESGPGQKADGGAKADGEAQGSG